MNTKNKTGKFRVIFRFLKGNIRFFVGTLLFSVLFTACNALIPQIVKYTADHILVLDDGKLVGKGPHEELLKNCNVYKEICMSQFSSQEVAQL